MQSPARLHYLDNLRALAMLSGVLFHAALAYSPMLHPLFPTADRQNAAVVDLIVWFPHLFRMPLFFILAGFFAALMIERRGMAGMMRNRLLRVALPFALFWPLLHHALSATTLHAAQTVQQLSPLLALILQFQQAEGLPSMPPGTAHLWFLYYLIWFYLLVWAARALQVEHWAERLCAWRPSLQLGVLPLALVPALASVSAPHPAPESLMPQFWAFGFFGLFFAWGYGLLRQQQLIERLRPYALGLLAGSIILYGLWISLIRAYADGAQMGWQTALLQASLAAYISVWMSLVCLVSGRALLNRSNRLLRYLADTSYWIYLVHLPVLFLIQYRLLDLPWHWTVKFIVAVALTFALALIGYELLVRRTVLARLLGPSRSARQAPAAAASRGMA